MKSPFSTFSAKRETEPCPNCGGSGFTYNEMDCSYCFGSGIVGSEEDEEDLYDFWNDNNE